ncbi:hypothetical protein M409DRAFT_36243 [Zasmidium cellare ATCC 36951]|uniref:CENP-V/GFA domain-containing protein n=1 Tax=Zasmidium cellare ATCC 36951 TaxID=1080233 RepID=A0A6A6CTG6_ZASCE|nr:uncharacterized protein M409DRAFT_36243 [Zasmidium cellare ATCC 36951]KAF2168776.1 hypothetical protein M409DRAFT_36243 [Zasmidium cellare ATCC 36951]
MTTRTSSCLCKSVQIEVTGTDKGAVLCHCANCQAQSGSAFMHNHRFTKSDIKFTKGEHLVKRYADKNTKSGNELTRGFCSNCGSTLFLMNPAFKGLTILTAGTMDGERTQPSMELFPENKYQWLGDVTGKSSKL